MELLTLKHWVNMYRLRAEAYREWGVEPEEIVEQYEYENRRDCGSLWRREEMTVTPEVCRLMILAKIEVIKELRLTTNRW